MREHELTTAGLREKIPSLETGDRVFLSGTVYTSRDAAHKELADRLLAEMSAGIRFAETGQRKEPPVRQALHLIHTVTAVRADRPTVQITFLFHSDDAVLYGCL